MSENPQLFELIEKNNLKTFLIKEEETLSSFFVIKVIKFVKRITIENLFGSPTELL